ncbi:MAG TPA: cbb3-type cytochrome oxidase assembly protein CcoS [Candidatus Eisenbacteria bacterium]|nr:cbb3-type cytochrome oxidase assembly protein CcoS [Candidatus Eisenbacteria bacterium]
MSVLYIVLPLALLVVGVAVLAFRWAAKRGQFDDLDTPAMRALHDDPAVRAPETPPRVDSGTP